MTDIGFKLWIVGIVLVLVTGCSFNREMPVAGQGEVQQTEEQARVEIPVTLETCSPEAGPPFSYRKGILVAGTIDKPDLARDLPGLAPLTSKRLETHLNALERFIVLATHDASFDSTGLGTAERVRYIGRQYATQFVVKLELQDLTIPSSEGWLSRLFKNSKQRNVLVNLYIYDTEFGALFHSQRYQRTVKGDVVGYPGNGRAVSTTWFKTDLGEAIDEVLKAMSLQINEMLACVPFSTEVITVKGNDIHINAGFIHGVGPGDALRVYPRSDVSAPDAPRKLGKNEGWIEVNAVFPNHSIAGFVQDNEGGNRVDIGDVVRAW